MDDSAISRTQLDMHELRGLIERLSQTVDRQQQTLIASRDELAKRTATQAGTELTGQLMVVHRTLEEMERRLEAARNERGQLLALQEIGAVVNSSLDLNQVLNTVMDAIIDLTQAERAILLLINEDTGKLEVQVARTKYREAISPADAYEISRSVVEVVTQTGDAVVTTNAQDDPRFSAQESVVSYRLLSILCVPLKIKDTITGVIYADNRITAGIFGDSDRDLLAAFANQAAVAIENALLFRQVRNHLIEITEMKELMDNVFESIASGVITIDESDRIALYNRAAELILGVPANTALHQVYQRVLTAMGLPVETLVADVRMNGGTKNTEMDVVVGKRPGVTSLNLTCSPLRDIQQETLGVALVVDDISERKRLESVRRYLPPALVDQVRDLDAAQRPQRRVMTVLFADVRGYSTYSEHVDPEKLFQIINGYFTEAVNAISHYQGLTDKFMGDAVMALFNTPLNPQDNHVERAARTALLIQSRVAAYNAGLSADHQLHFGIGVHTGEAVVGNVGSSLRKDYSAIGDAVNLAKRLQEVAEPDQIIVSQVVWSDVSRWAHLEALPPVQVKGRQALEQIYRLRG